VIMIRSLAGSRLPGKAQNDGRRWGHRRRRVIISMYQGNRAAGGDDAGGGLPSWAARTIRGGRTGAGSGARVPPCQGGGVHMVNRPPPSSPRGTPDREAARVCGGVGNRGLPSRALGGWGQRGAGA